ncbi:glycoside hydrolase family 25 protein [Devosia faecipullorum]|uniref:glycoside hydrolase family 25 protein n=1 Tax=Devosia faecipullorum TaxID=2755039 RepID=UPI00187BB7A5|nr:GH25 family lysozyme [Devosia faecipullorum]MBE7733504.1 glycoside hydrolase family 25 protein [Devosia faecipullorum]
MAIAPVTRPFSTLMRGVMIGIIAAALAACATTGGLYGAIPGDKRPHSGVDRARGMPIQGIDVARYQENVDFAKARAAGTHFVFMKATEGKDYVDPDFQRNWARARESGMPHGAYHFMTWCSTAAEQAEWFMRNVPADPSAMPPVLDLEWNNHSSCKTKPSKADAMEKIRVMLVAMERHTGKLPIIYTDMNFHRDILEGEYLPNAFWLRSTAAEPHERYRNRTWTFWQYTQTGVVPGVRGEVDRNVFYGNREDWLMFLWTGCDPRAIAALQASGRCQAAK